MEIKLSIEGVKDLVKLGEVHINMNLAIKPTQKPVEIEEKAVDESEEESE